MWLWRRSSRDSNPTSWLPSSGHRTSGPSGGHREEGRWCSRDRHSFTHKDSPPGQEAQKQWTYHTIGSVPTTNGSPLSPQTSASPAQKHPEFPDETSNTAQKENTASPPAAGSCCSSRKQTAPATPNGSHSPMQGDRNTISSESTHPAPKNGSYKQPMSSGGGCCSNKARGPAQLPQAPLPDLQPALLPGYQQQIQQLNQAQPAVYIQNPGNGVAFWQGQMPPQMPTQANGYVYMNGIAPQYPPTYQVYPPVTVVGAYPVMAGLTAEQNRQINSILGRPMQCQCGDVCECLGCIDHPFNTVTRDYVASAINVADWTKNGDEDVDGSTEDMHSSEASSAMPSPAGDPLLEQMLPHPEMQQTVSSDYLVFNYSYGCLGEPEHCPCGDDCACVGCTIHGGSSNGNNANGGINLGSHPA
ncbi:uncharacterized protein B0I36DRAFT_27420 [Microdochium trichocladiopsis]|uniref:Uncharacterized protein n=1 Tax=Microdochium trichocladiopsis TaxID=1682393 RepID=A0A9P9BHW8_9PEZI|nr:uncharacterized protein B0I36DRAFT_27420 [Microdochium trichocladiopsis]KAH7020965.1 hypothetical protein B0I36DRAFT_27420 [Microdochium trichocladiopsis]